jgi:flagellar biosynthetic protein FliR
VVNGSLASVVGGALRETAVGFLMGFGAYITFEGINLGAQLVGYQMGFGTVSLMDPQNQSQVSIMVPLQGWLALMVFFLTDMHYELIHVFISSFHVTHALTASAWNSGALAKAVMLVTGKLFVLAIQIAAPFTLVMLLCNVAIGVLSRLMPQMNVMLFSFPITILLGLSALYLFAPDLLGYLESALGDMSADLMTLLKAV